MNRLLTLLLCCLPLAAYSQHIDLELQTFATGLNKPVAIRHAGDERLFIVEQPGRIMVLDTNGSVAATPFLDIRSRVRDNAGERGLLGLAFHPQFADNGYFYVNYTTEPNAATVVSRFSVDPSDRNRALPNSEKVILTFEQPFGNHNGGDIVFGPDGYLYIATGDGGSANDPQNKGQDRLTFLGKILRIDVDGGDPYTIPADNPFGQVDDTLDEIWALGLRNPWRISFDRQTGDLWIADVGQNEYEEINFEPAGSTGGRNYGWRCYEGNEPFNTQNCPSVDALTAPVLAYAHSGTNGCSVTGGYVYRGDTYADMRGVYLYTDFCSGRIWGLRSDGAGGFDNEFLLDGAGGQYSSFGEDQNGELYLAARGFGRIYRLVDTSFVSSTRGVMAGRFPLIVRPQPFSVTLTLEMELPQNRSANLKILSLDGKLLTRRDSLVPGRQTLQFATADWPAGTYLLVLEVDGLRRVERIVKL
jgi:glucose/arabinose dehydrogenase